MLHFISSFLFVFNFLLLATYGYYYDIKWYEGMPLDHFAFANNNTFSMRYLINQTYWHPGGPIFFYCGNEGDITLFADNTGLMWDIAPDFGAMVVFAEHRFYGKTLPFGNDSYKSPDNLGYLSTEQALADYAVFLRWLKEQSIPEALESPVIAFGGSYGGMLAAWFRIKYPNIVVGSLASSAPILQFTDITPCWAFSAVVTRTFANSGKNCDQVIKKSWDAFRRLGNTTDGRAWINSKFGLCENSTVDSPDDIELLFNFLSDSWGYLAMIDYPYEANFLMPVPGWPVQAACKYMTNPNANDTDLLTQVFNGLSVYQNYTGAQPCFSFKVTTTSALGDDGWNFQSCTEMVMPMCNNGTDMFFESPWDINAVTEQCQQQFGVSPRVDWATTVYGGTDLSAASNIIFSNGDLDPWSAGGVTTEIEGSDGSLIVLYIKESGHHLDLRSPNANDTIYVTHARETELAIIKCWIEQPLRHCTLADIGTTVATSTSSHTGSISPKPTGAGDNVAPYSLAITLMLLVHGYTWLLKPSLQ